MSLSVDIQKVLGDFSVAVRFECAGGIIAIFGKSGAGKTSIVQMMAGLIRPQSGSIQFGDATVFDSTLGIDTPPHKRRVGYVFQDARLFPHMNVRRNLDYGRRWRGFEDLVVLQRLVLRVQLPVRLAPALRLLRYRLQL